MNLKKKNTIFFFFILLLLPLLTSFINLGDFSSTNSQFNNEHVPKSSDYWTIGPIHIEATMGIGAEYTWAEAVLEDWCSGDGSLLTPYLLENITIDGGGIDSCILIENSVGVFFTIRNCTLINSGTDITANAGIKIEYCTNGTIDDNKVLNHVKNGIMLENSDYNYITHNIIDNSSAGVRLYSSDHNEVFDNDITEESTVISSTGIYIDSTSEFNLASENYVFNHTTGIEISSAAAVNNTLFNNLLVNNTIYGIWIKTGCNNNTIELNEIRGSNFGLEVSGDGNIFFRNSLIESTDDNVRNWGSHNRWDNGSIGNYWDDYAGQDLNDDGIGETPYIITLLGGQDNFPIWNDGFDLPKPIYVNNNWTETISLYNYLSGSGTWSDPYVIEDITIDAQGSGSGILIESTNEYFIIRNCTIYDIPSWNGMSYDAGIKIYGADNGKIYNNTIYDTEYAGIYLLYADNNTVFENTLYQNDIWGINTRWNSDNRIINNTVSASFIDIGFYNCENTTLRDNKMQQSGFFIRADNLQRADSHYIPHSNTLNGERFYYYINQDFLSSTDFPNVAQIILVNCHNSSISDIEFSHAYRSISLYYSHDNTIKNCNFSSTNDYFIYLAYSEGNTIQDNRFANDDAIYIEDYSHYNIIRNNDFTATGNGIMLSDHATNNQVYNNEIEGGTRGVWLTSFSTSNMIFGNNISDLSLWGIQIQSFSNLNQVYENIISSCGDTSERGGIYIDTDSNTIWKNLVNANELGVFFDTNSNMNGFYNNSFSSNIKHAQDDGNNNYWNITTIGNYWDNYTGTDVDDNLIGDISHPIVGSAASFDYLPIWDDGDDVGPMISISSPSIDSYYSNPPTIQVSITDRTEVNETWYTIIGSGVNHTFIGTNFDVDMTSWMNELDGSVTIRIYANDTIGNITFKDISLNKDTINPQIIIYEPLGGTEFGENSPSFNLTITELNIYQLWFKVNDSSTNYYQSIVSGENVFSMESSIWDAIPDGHVLISFYINDLAGNTDTISVTIIKDTSTSTPPPGIPGYDLGILIVMISFFSMIIIVKRKNLQKNT